MESKGSTLFLSMIIMSVVLTTGIAISLLLSRQIREIPVMEDHVVAFYVAESAIDHISELGEQFEEGVWTEISFNELSKTFLYKAEKTTEGVFSVMVNTGDRYYSFDLKEKDYIEEDPPVEDPENVFVFNYENLLGWSSVTMRYQITDLSGAILRDDMTPINYENWQRNEININEVNRLRTYFCEGLAEENAGCQTDGMYPGGELFYNLDNALGVCILNSQTGKSCLSPNTFVVYYNNPNNWANVTMRYQITDYSSNTAIIQDDMIESEKYLGWVKNEINIENIESLRTYFCEGTAGLENDGCTDDPGSIPYPSWYTDIDIADAMIVCVEDGVKRDCFSPLVDSLY